MQSTLSLYIQASGHMDEHVQTDGLPKYSTSTHSHTCREHTEHTRIPLIRWWRVWGLLSCSLLVQICVWCLHTYMCVCIDIFFFVHFYEYVWGWLCLSPNFTRFTYCFMRKARTHTETHAHALTHTRRPCDGDESETDYFLPPSHRDLSLRGNMLTSLPEGLFGGLSALRSVDIQGLAQFRMKWYLRITSVVF